MQDDAQEPAPDSDLPPEEPFEDDLPCIRCHYNLRGLMPEGKCPECGTAIRKSLDYALERILCLACMKPSHPSAAVCSACGAPLHTAGATADYFRLQPRGVRRRPAGLDAETETELARMEARQKTKWVPPPSIAGVFVVAGFCAGLALFLLGLAADAWHAGDDDVSTIMIVFACGAMGVVLLRWRRYARQRAEYLAFRARRLRELETSADAATPSAVAAGQNPEANADAALEPQPPAESPP